MSKNPDTQFRERFDQKYGFKTAGKSVYEFETGLSEKTVKEISKVKIEPDWLSKYRKDSLQLFFKKPLPTWGPDLSEIDFDDIVYYAKPSDSQANNWEDVPTQIRDTFEKLGIPQAERKFLAGVGAQMESENVYHSLQARLHRLGVVFVDPDTALNPTKEKIKQQNLNYETMMIAHKHFIKWFGKVIPKEDNKFASLNSAVFSGGSFIYVPENVEVDLPLQAYFRINKENMGQFERTLIIADKGAKLHYIEGCFTKGTPILTSLGTKAIEEIKAGDEVLTDKVRNKRVYKTQVRKYAGKLFSIKYYGDSSKEIKTTSEHPFLAVRREREEYRNTNWKTEWMNASDLRKGDYACIPINRLVDSLDVRTFSIRKGNGRHGFKNIPLALHTDKDFFRLIGYYLAEGTTLGEHYVTFTFNKNERKYLDDVISLLAKYFGKKPLEYKEYKNGITLVLCSTIAARFFKNEFGFKAENKHLPSWALLENLEKQKELIKGYWRGDGSYMYVQYAGGVKRTFRINSISEKLISQIRDILLRQNVFASINKSPRDGRHTVFALIIGGEFLIPFAALVDVYPSNEVAVGSQVQFQKLLGVNAKSFVKISESYAFVPIKSVSFEEVNDLDVYNFSVEDDESYVANGVVVHNCSAPQYRGKRHSLHTAVVEIVAMENAKVRYTTLQNWSSNVYNLVTKRAFAYENAYVEWLDANIGCLAGNSKIFLNNEIKEIKDIERGDTVLSIDQNFEFERKKVTGKKYSGAKMVYKLETENHREVFATGNHPFLAIKKSGKRQIIRWTPLNELSENDYVGISGEVPDFGIPMKIDYSKKSGNKDIVYPIETTATLLWLLGFYLGDGYVHGSRMYFAVPEKDKSQVKVIAGVRQIFNLDKYEKRQNIIRFNSVDLINFFKHLGFEGNARTKKLPNWINKLPQEQKRALIDGYIDADGYRRKGHKNISITSVNKELLEQIKILAISCGLDARKISRWSRKEKKPLGKVEKEYTHYFLYFGDQKFKSQTEFVRILKIEEVGIQDTWDIEVEGAHNFLANGFIVHNSKITMKYPSIYLLGKNARADILSVAYAGKNQIQDAGGKAVHLAPNTTSKIISKSVSKDGGKSIYRGLLHIGKKANYAKSTVRCDALLIDEFSKTDTIPYNEIRNDTATVTHEASVGKIGEDLIFYLMSRGLSEQQALGMVVNGFLEVFTKELPMEYAVEFNRLIQLEMSGSVG